MGYDERKNTKGAQKKFHRNGTFNLKMEGWKNHF